MTQPLEKQTVAQLRKAATKKKNRVCGTPSKMKKGELISFLKEGKGGGTKMSVGPKHSQMRRLCGKDRAKVVMTRGRKRKR